jgi:type 1 glutamine amidotransferase
LPRLKTLLFSGGGVHDAKGVGQEMYKALTACEDFQVTYVEEDLAVFEAPKLDAYDVVVLFHTGGVLTDAQKNGLLNWIASGKGFVGTHSAADSFKENPEYIAMIGGFFIGHPHYRQYQVSVLDPEHPITEGLEEFMVTDEQYVTDYDPRNHVLATALYKGKITPVAWTKPWGKGRVFWLALGHDPAACRQEMFALLLQKGVRWTGTVDGQ